MASRCCRSSAKPTLTKSNLTEHFPYKKRPFQDINLIRFRCSIITSESDSCYGNSDRTEIEVGRFQSLPNFLGILAPILTTTNQPINAVELSIPVKLSWPTVRIQTFRGPPCPHRIRGQSRSAIGTRSLRKRWFAINTHHTTRTRLGPAIMTCHKYRSDAHKNHPRDHPIRPAFYRLATRRELITRRI